MSDEPSVSDFVAALGSRAPTPGGGAASALTGALAAALAEMVARFTVGRASYREVEPAAQAILQRAEQARQALLALVAEDERAFGVVSAAYALPRTPDAERDARDAAIQAALGEAMQPPLRGLRLCAAVVELARDIARIGNATVLSDAACAATLGEAASRACALNVLANVALLHDSDAGAHAMAEARDTLAAISPVCAEALVIVYQRMGVTGL